MILAIETIVIGQLLATLTAVVLGGLGFYSTRRQATVAVLPQMDKNEIDRIDSLYNQQQRIVDNLQSENDRKERRIVTLEAQVVVLQDGLETCHRSSAKMEIEIQDLNRQLVDARHQIETMRGTVT